MKSIFLFACVVALALLSGCIKVEVEAPHVQSQDNSDSTVVKDDSDSTVVKDADESMENIVINDSIVRNSFETRISGSQIEELNCYTRLHSEFQKLNTSKNVIKEVGYVYSLTNTMPVITDKDNCKVLTVTNDVSSTEADVTFEGTLEQLDFNSTYYVRSYVICKVGDKADTVIYNNHALEYKTVLPEDFWIQRNDAPSAMMGRTLPFSTSVYINGMGLELYRSTLPKNVLDLDSTVFVYGGKNGNTLFNDLWKYNPVNDTWQQMGTFEKGEVMDKTGPARRCNGAMLAYPNIKASDVLLFIIGGEISTDEYTGTIFYYSTKGNRFAHQVDHPNAHEKFTMYDENGNAMLECVYEKNEDGSYKLDSDGNKIPAKNDDGSIKYVLDDYGQPKVLQTSSTRNYIESLPLYKETQNGRHYYGLAGCVAFTLADRGFTKFFVAFGKTDMSSDGQKHISTVVYEYDPMYDKDRQGPDLLYPAWKMLSTVNDNAVEGFYQPVCVRCGDRVIVGSGESSNKGLSKNFYQLSYSISNQNIRMEKLSTEGLEDFKPRAAAAAFHLSYTKSGASYDRFYVGTGRTCLESEYYGNHEQLLNDFWCYDFVDGKWSKKADCSNIVRQGAVGFAIKRVGDYFANNYGGNVRGMFSFGEGCIPGTGTSTLNDNWEYIP